MARRWWVLLAVGIGAACGSDGDEAASGGGSGGSGQSPDQTGDACEVADDCYPGVDLTLLSGAALCLTDVPHGYCTHICTEDADCCAAAGECQTDLLQVCSPFESRPELYCFLSCEDADLRPAPDAGTTDVDPDEFCRREANSNFGCRSTGGGSANRRVCMPVGCGDTVLRDAYPGCIAAADQVTCEGLGGSWVGGACRCPTGQDDCTCTRGSHCLGRCLTPVPAGGDCTAVADGLCAPTTDPAGCWCVLDDAGVATQQCFD